jgi:hypothetical protein
MLATGLLYKFIRPRRQRRERRRALLVAGRAMLADGLLCKHL